MNGLRFWITFLMPDWSTMKGQGRRSSHLTDFRLSKSLSAVEVSETLAIAAARGRTAFKTVRGSGLERFRAGKPPSIFQRKE